MGRLNLGLVSKAIAALAVALFIASVKAEGQESFASHLSGYWQYTSASSGIFKTDDTDCLLSQFTLSPGYKTNFGLSFYVPVDFSFLGYNLGSTKNFERQGCLGLGLGYDLTKRGDPLGLEVAASCVSTILDADVRYLLPRLDFRVGFKGSHYGAYCGLGVAVFHPYTKGFDDKVMMSVSFGCWIF